MKARSKTLYLFIALCIMLNKNAQSQTKLPEARIFGKYPNALVLKESEITRSLNFSKGEKVVMDISAELKISGTVIANDKKSSQIQQVVVKVPELNNSLVQITKITQPNSPIQYTGHIINKESGDGYRLIKNEKGEYVFTKYLLKDVLQVCSQ